MRTFPRLSEAEPAEAFGNIRHTVMEMVGSTELKEAKNEAFRVKQHTRQTQKQRKGRSVPK